METNILEVINPLQIDDLTTLIIGERFEVTEYLEDGLVTIVCTKGLNKGLDLDLTMGEISKTFKVI